MTRGETDPAKFRPGKPFNHSPQAKKRRKRKTNNDYFVSMVGVPKERTCERCGITKPITEYYIIRGNSYRSICKECYKAEVTERQKL